MTDDRDDKGNHKMTMQSPLLMPSGDQPIARIGENSMMSDELPKDLYIPPDALRVLLTTFEGPLDLLLYLIRKHNIDVMDIPIADISRQYMDYLRLMQALDIDLAAEYLVMAALLAEIKSKLLLPKPSSQDDSEDVDPRMALIERLKAYEQFKKAAEDLDELPRVERDIYLVLVDQPSDVFTRELMPLTATDLITVLAEVYERAQLYTAHAVSREMLSIRDRMSRILERVSTLAPHSGQCMTGFLSKEEGRLGVVVTLIALLELTRQSLIEINQQAPFSPIMIYAKGSSDS